MKKFGQVFVGAAILMLVSCDRYFYWGVVPFFSSYKATIDVCGVTGLILLPYFFLGKVARLYLIVIFSYLLLMTSVSGWLVNKFNLVPDGAWVFILLETSCEEVRAFVRDALTWRMILMLFCLGLVYSLFVVFIWRTCILARLKRPRIWGLVCLGVCCVLFMPISGLHATVKRSGFITLPWSSVRMYGTYRNLMEVRRHPALPERLQLCSKQGHAPIGVIVVGESVTRNRMGLYGYQRETTPLLAEIRSELFVFSDVLGSWWETSGSIRYLMSDANIDSMDGLVHYTFTEACRRAGYRGVLLSAQYHIAGATTTIGAIFEGCREQHYSKSKDILKTNYDDALTDLLREQLTRAKPDEPLLVVMHQVGSHSPAEWHYPPDRAYYADSPYDNSIRFLDENLTDAISLLKEKKRPAFLIYVTDHGETPSAKSWRVFDDIDLWEIPLIVWLSPEYRADYPEIVKRLNATENLPLQSDELMQGFLSIACVSGIPQEKDGRRDFLSTNFQGRVTRKIMGGRVYEKGFYGRKEPVE